MSARALGGMAIAALASVLAWHAWRSDELPSDAPVRPEPRRAADVTASTAPPAVDATSSTAAATAPSVAAAPADMPEVVIDAHDAAFTRERRDPAWAAAAERELRERFRTIRGARLADTACRTQICRLILIGSREQIERTIAELGGAHGLHGYATVALTPPEPRDDESYAMRAYAKVSR